MSRRSTYGKKDRERYARERKEQKQADHRTWQQKVEERERASAHERKGTER